MGRYNTFSGRIRSYGGAGDKAVKQGTVSAGSAILSVVASFDPTTATGSPATLATLPAGAIPLGAQSFGGATGGTNPTVDIGTASALAGIANELDADGTTSLTGTGALVGSALASDTAVTGTVGASAATGGSTTVAIWYVMQDETSGGDASGV